jgi:membrane protease YdiL (CAAX protease family)
VEEVVFRGLSFNFLRRGFSLPVAIFSQAVLFAAFHGALLQRFYAFLAAVVLAWVYARCGTLTAPLILHMVFNIINIPLPAAAWGRWLFLLAGGAVLAVSLLGIRVRTTARRAP